MYYLYFVCFTYFLIGTDVVRSKPDYLFSYDAGVWLKLHTSPATWEEAYLRCSNEGAVLASPLNKELSDALLSQMKQCNVIERIFLGIHDLFSKGDYVTVEGVPLSDMEVSCVPRSSEADADCLTLTADGQGHFSSCKEPRPFICYKKLHNQTINECGTFDNNYRLNKETGSCYKFHNQKRSWSGAYRTCAAEGAYLVILNDDEEARVVNKLFPPHTKDASQWETYHIGLVAWGKDRIWTTLHGDRIEDVFNKWDHGQPDNSQGHQYRGSLLWKGTLDDVSEDAPCMFVCEKSPNSTQFEVLSPCSEQLLKLCNNCDAPQIDHRQV